MIDNNIRSEKTTPFTLLARGSFFGLIMGSIHITIAIFLFMMPWIFELYTDGLDPPILFTILFFAVALIFFIVGLTAFIHAFTPKRVVQYNDVSNKIILQGYQPLSWEKKELFLSEIEEVDVLVRPGPKESFRRSLLLFLLFGVWRSFFKNIIQVYTKMYDKKYGLYFKTKNEVIIASSVVRPYAAAKNIKKLLEIKKQHLESNQNIVPAEEHIAQEIQTTTLSEVVAVKDPRQKSRFSVTVAIMLATVLIIGSSIWFPKLIANEIREGKYIEIVSDVKVTFTGGERGNEILIVGSVKNTHKSKSFDVLLEIALLDKYGSELSSFYCPKYSGFAGETINPGEIWNFEESFEFSQYQNVRSVKIIKMICKLKKE